MIMNRALIRFVLPMALIVTALAWWPKRVVGQAGAASIAMPSTKNGEWPMYTADLRGSKYSPIDLIEATDFNKLEVVWRFRTVNHGVRPANKHERMPLM